jgi:WD40 repeat protein
MNSITNDLSPLDDLEIICLEHNIPCLGICSNFNCNSKVKFLCMKCIKSNNTCITLQKHELISLSEILYRFYNKLNTVDIKLIQKIQKLGKAIKISNYDDINNFEKKYKNIQAQTLWIKNTYQDLIDEFLETFKENNAKKIYNLKLLSKTDENIDKDISNILLNIRMPTIDKKSVMNEKKLKKIIEEGNKLSSPNNFVNSIKLLNNRSKSSEIINKLNEKIFANKVCSNISNIGNNKANLEKKIDNILEELESKFDKSFEALKESLLSISKAPNASSYYHPQFINFKTNPKNLYFNKDLCINAHKFNTIDKVFCVFNSFNNQNLVVWGSSLNSLVFYDLDNDKIIKTIDNAHYQLIYCCRHYPNKKKKIDYIITTSSNRSVKVWNANNFTCEVDIKMTYTNKSIFSACLIFDVNDVHNLIVTSSPNDFMKIFDFNAKLKYIFGSSDNNTIFVNNYYDTKIKTHYIINGSGSDIKSYDLRNRQIYNRYVGKPRSFHTSAVVFENKSEVTLIECDGNGYIRLWNFHTAELIKTIYIRPFIILRGMCLWNNKYLIVGSSDHQIKLVDLKLGKIVQTFKEHTGKVCTVEKIESKKYGECLLSQGLDGKIKLWTSS